MSINPKVTETDRLITLKELLGVLSISKTSHFAKLDRNSNQYDPEYPRPIYIGCRTVRYIEREVREWILMKKEARQ
jgi:prophage regulatory protein